MKMKMRYFLLLVFVSGLAGCHDDEKAPKGKYEQGTVIVNEGAFGASNGTLTHFNSASGEAQQNIFKSTGSQFAGDVVQSLTIAGDKGFVVVNGDDKIQVVNAKTFEGISTITHADIVSPRYIQVINNKAYISVWGPYDDNYSLIDSYVLVYDLNTNATLKKIDTDEGVENLVYNGEKLFASNFNFGGSSTVAVINPSDNTLVKQIEVGPGPAGIVIDNNKKLWVVTSGTYQGKDGKLVKINTSTLEVESEIALGLNPDNDLAITSDKKNLIFSSGNLIYKMSIDATAAPTTPYITASDVVTPYSLGVDPVTSEVYIGDALNFATPGVVFVYKADGTLKTSFPSGINPTQFIFR
jgi:DNA-binding beta-propeller fold protein YncE